MNVLIIHRLDGTSIYLYVRIAHGNINNIVKNTTE